MVKNIINDYEIKTVALKRNIFTLGGKVTDPSVTNPATFLNLPEKMFQRVNARPEIRGKMREYACRSGTYFKNPCLAGNPADPPPAVSWSSEANRER
jgi:hypothetical protein